MNVSSVWTLDMSMYHFPLNFLNLPVSHTNLFTVVKGELTVPEEALKVNTSKFTIIYRFTSIINVSTKALLFPDLLQHEKFTSGLQLSHKPCSSETNTGSNKSPAKTPTKAVKSPSGSRASADGVTSSRDSQTKPADAHKAEERTGEQLRSAKLFAQTVAGFFFFFFLFSAYCCRLILRNVTCGDFPVPQRSKMCVHVLQICCRWQHFVIQVCSILKYEA